MEAIMRLQPSIIAATIITFLIGSIHSIPINYLEKRRTFIIAETSKRIGANLKLNYRERLVNHYLMVQKELAVEASRLTTEPYLASRHFFQVKEEIEKTSIFDIIRMMPKGANLHLHDATIVPLEWIVKNLTYLPHLYTKERQGNTPRKFKFSETPLETEDGLREVAQLRDDMGVSSLSGKQRLDEIFLSELSLFTPDPYNTYKSGNDIWNKFNDYFSIFEGLRSTLRIAKMCLKKAIEDFYADGIQYAEFREGFLFDQNGVDLTEGYLMQVMDVVKEFQAKHPDFLGIKFILTGHRHFSEGRMQEQVERVAELMRMFPDLVRGFDIDSHEDVGHTNFYYINELVKKDQPALPFYFHAGETSWNYGADINLVDAVLLNASRIGHGFAALKHPKVMEAIREQGIVIEVQPVSNQVLGFVNDLRAHPGATFIANNDRITISSDNFPLWGALPLSHDFYMAFMGLGSTKDDLRLLKQLAINSIQFSTMGKRAKAKAMDKWRQRWTTFIDDVITKYHLL